MKARFIVGNRLYTAETRLDKTDCHFYSDVARVIGNPEHDDCIVEKTLLTHGSERPDWEEQEWVVKIDKALDR